MTKPLSPDAEITSRKTALNEAWNATRRFSMADQALFARLSGDRNPMHMDDVAARRTQAGAAAVHGMHVVLWVLDELAARLPGFATLNALKVDFSKFVHLEHDVTLALRQQRGTQIKVEAMVNGRAAVTITLKFGSAGSASEMPAFTTLPDLPVGDEPLAPSQEVMKTFGGWLAPVAAEREFEAAFPWACRALGARRVSALSLLSTLTGMACPGLHSIFSDLSIHIVDGGESRPGIGARTKSIDPRFRMVTLIVGGAGISGEIVTFERFAPIEVSLANVRSIVRQDEFSDRTALIIGGSRGLGAATAKLIVAGGGRVVVTYFRGVREAERLQAELVSEFGEKACRLLRFEVGNATRPGLEELGCEITHLYYFATPQIFRQSSDVFERNIFDEFVKFYVLGIAEILTALTKGKPRLDLSVLYPSSIFVEHRPAHMAEYAMAKAAGEVLCQEFARGTPGLTITAPRLPRILTDQTASVPPVEACDAIATILPVLRAERGGRI